MKGKFKVHAGCGFFAGLRGRGTAFLRLGFGGRGISARYKRAGIVALGAVLETAAALAADSSAGLRSPQDIARLRIEELADIEITSVSKKQELLSDAAAAVFVITHEDIRRAGATSLPEALRLAPNLQVAQTNANTYAISARGFNIGGANKLLVLIDGRSVYSPLNSGVFWDAQNVMLEDVERIEVISGSGGTLWGSNAVNGVINIITRKAADTQGALLSLGAGNRESMAAVRQGWKLGDDASMRVYAKGFRRTDTENAAGVGAGDSWHARQAGFRADWGAEGNGVTLQGDVYEGVYDLPSNLDDKTRSGGNLLGRWSRTLASGSSFQVQAYFDRVRQTVPGVAGFGESSDTYDIQAQHRFTLGNAHDLVWGGGYRLWRNVQTNGPLIAFVPPSFDLKLADLFVQDTISLDEHLKLTLAAKLEHNSYTGMEIQPNARLAWKPNEHSLLWSAVSRAVRTPSRVDRDFYVLNFPALPLQGGPDFRSEKLTAYEIGYRAQPSPSLSYSVSAFYNAYDYLRTIEPGPGGAVVLGNQIEGNTYGVEMWGSYRINDDWRLSAGYSALRERLQYKPDSARSPLNGSVTSATGNDPAHQFSLRSTMNLPHATELDLTLRRIGALPDPAVPAYTALDARLGWHVSKDLELSFSATNLTDGRHPEFGAAPSRSEIGRSFFLSLLWKR